MFEALLTPKKAGLKADEPIAPSFYRLRLHDPGGEEKDLYDPYAFPPVLTDYDLYLTGEGKQYLEYEKLGAHLREVDGMRGVQFGVWAPNAQRVSVVGDFNSWDGRVHPMRNRGSSGVWEIFIPELGEGTLYKFEILSRVEKPHEIEIGSITDFQPSCVRRPRRWYAILKSISGTTPCGSMRAVRGTEAPRAPMSICSCEIHAGLVAPQIPRKGFRWLTYREMAEELITPM